MQGWLWICVGVQCVGHQQWVGVQTRALFFPHSFLSTSPTYTLELLHKFRWLAGARGKAVVHVVAVDQAGNVKLERGVRGAFLGFRRDSRFFGGLIAFLSEDLGVNIG
ncbi:hypothetical protein Taro_030940 [Colocasia esculenta]|uniref:Uncharacterized protein n=1 Tax=Colocasia esculenta TaxID=4460 RepID=A0A843VHL8_COLES|nr:hypothetical protein [Colocasia esculenta]